MDKNLYSQNKNFQNTKVIDEQHKLNEEIPTSNQTIKRADGLHLSKIMRPNHPSDESVNQHCVKPTFRTNSQLQQNDQSQQENKDQYGKQTENMYWYPYKHTSRNCNLKSKNQEALSKNDPFIHSSIPTLSFADRKTIPIPSIKENLKTSGLHPLTLQRKRQVRSVDGLRNGFKEQAKGDKSQKKVDHEPGFYKTGYLITGSSAFKHHFESDLDKITRQNLRKSRSEQMFETDMKDPIEYTNQVTARTGWAGKQNQEFSQEKSSKDSFIKNHKNDYVKLNTFNNTIEDFKILQNFDFDHKRIK